MSEQQGDWLQLTEEDLARAQRLTGQRPQLSGVLHISDEDVAPAAEPAGRIQIEIAPEARPPERVATAPPLTITLEDLTPAGPQPQRDERLRALELQLLTLVNEARARHLPGWLPNRALQWHEGLATIARGHSADMIRRHFVEHTSPEGHSASDRVGRQGIRFVACGENIGVVYGDNSHTDQGAYDIHNAFMNQPRSLSNHRGNILNPVWTHIGIGLAYNPEGTLVVTQNFISAPGGIAGSTASAR